MDLRFNDEETAFRDEGRSFFKKSLPENIRRKMVEGKKIGKEDIVTWQRILNKKGWAVSHWAAEWGGTGQGPVEAEVAGANRQYRRLVVPGIFRARLRLRPRFAQDHREARRRPLRGERPENLDHARAIRRLDFLPRAHQSGIDKPG